MCCSSVANGRLFGREIIACVGIKHLKTHDTLQKSAKNSKKKWFKSLLATDMAMENSRLKKRICHLLVHF
jgi:hypothetical protein